MKDIYRIPISQFLLLLVILTLSVGTGYAQNDLPGIFPTLKSPSDGSEDQPTNPTLEWEEVVGADTYHLQVATDPDFSDLAVDEDSLTSTSRQVSDLEYGTTYHWRVRASNTTGTTNWSDAWSFTTRESETLPPAAPALSSPENGSAELDTSLTMRWNAADRANTYWIQISNDPNFNSLVVSQSGLTQTDYQVSKLNHESTYYWRVRASNSEGYSDWSAEWNFSTKQSAPDPPSAPSLRSPSDGASDVHVNATVAWDSTERADNYRLQVATDSAFSNFVVDTTDITSTELQLQELNHNTTYHWRVRASNEGGSSSWSSAWTFTTIEEAPEVPTLSSPGDGDSAVTTKPTLEWNAAERADSYRIQVSDSSDFTSPSTDTSGISGTSLTLDSLEHSTIYHWRTRASNEGGQSGWSDPWSFTTEDPDPVLPGTPALSSPADGDTNVVTNPTFDWDTAERAEIYRIQIASDSSFSNVLADSAGLNKTEIQAGRLKHSTRYHWRIQASNEQGSGDWSEEWSFTTIERVPDKPKLASPENGVSDVAVHPELAWNHATRADSYRVQVSVNADFTSTITDKSNLTDTTLQLSSLDHSTTYHWRVRARNDGGAGRWTDAWSFTTREQPTDPPADPALSSPADGSDGISTDTTLTWSASDRAETYWVQVATDPGFDSKVVNQSGLPSTDYRVTGLSDTTTHYWRVRASNDEGYSDWSSVWNFATGINTPEPPAVPTLRSPSNGASGISVTPGLEWETSDRASTYRLQLATDSDFSSLVADTDSLTDTEYQADSLNHSSRYFWRVLAANNGASSDWSAARSFTTISSTDMLEAIQPTDKTMIGGGKTYRIRWNANRQIQAVNLAYRLNPDESWILIAGNVEASAGEYSWEVPNRSSDRARIKITDEEDSTRTAVSPPFTIYAESIDMQQTYTFHSADDATNYRLVGLPANSGIPLDEFFNGEPGRDWNAFYDNGQESDYLVEYDESDQFAFRAGRGFWAISKKKVSINRSIETVPMNGDTSYSVPLHEGWNIISNPFDIPISWDAVQERNKVGGPLWSFDGSYTRTDTFKLYRGYYFYNENGRSELEIPYESPSKPSLRPPENKSKQKESETPTLRLAVIGDQSPQSWIEVGFNREATYRAPPGDFQDYTLTIHSKEKEAESAPLKTEYRSEVGELQEFELQLKAKTGKQIQFKSKGEESLKSHTVKLLNRQTGQTYDFHEDNTALVNPSQKHTRYTLLIGTPDAVQQYKQENAPTSFRLNQNYPNPFNNQTVIEYSIPKRADNQQVRLEIYNILGKKVQTLVNEKQSAGFHTVRWNGTGNGGRTLSSGIYLYRLHVGSHTKTEKMTLVK